MKRGSGAVWVMVVVLVAVVGSSLAAGGLTLPPEEAPVLRGVRLTEWSPCEEVAGRGGAFLLYAGRSLSPEEREAVLGVGSAEVKWMGPGVYRVRFAGDGRAVCGFGWVQGARSYDWRLKLGSSLQAALETAEDEIELELSFHGGVADGEQEEYLSRYGLELLEREDEARVVVRIPRDRDLVERLARDADVELLSATTVQRKTMSRESAYVTRTETARNPVYGLTGRGIRIGQWEKCVADQNHEAFGGRVTNAQDQNNDNDAGLKHATRVAGILTAEPPPGGNTPNRDKVLGMAPAVRVTVWDWTSHLQEKEQAYDSTSQAIQIDTNSWGLVIGWTNCGGFYCDHFTDNQYLFGAYTTESEKVDELVADHGAISFWAAGNDANDEGIDPHYHGDGSREYRNCEHPYRDGTQPGYGTIGPRASGKNVITVGAVHKDASVAGFSSRGPVLDGRIKPDVVAPGVQVFSTVPNNQYDSRSGTSYATPVAAGSTALLLQEMRDRGLDWTPELIKALLIHTARDQVTTDSSSDRVDPRGPDYTYGWGLIDTRAAINVIRSHSTDNPMWETGEIRKEGAAQEFSFDHDGGAFRVTLVWTDPPGVADDASQSDLVIDLDLELVNPRGEVLYRSWYMPYQKSGRDADMSAPAKRCTGSDCTGKRNDRDNVEVADITAEEGIKGQWKVRVVGRRVPQGVARYAVILPREVQSPDPVGPSRGSVWSVGERREVQWNPGDGRGWVSIEYHCGTGEWTTLTSKTENDGSWMWDTVNAEQCVEKAELRVLREDQGSAGLSAWFTVEEPDSWLKEEDPPSSPNPSTYTTEVVFRARFGDPDGEPVNWVRVHLEGPGGEERDEEMARVSGELGDPEGALYEVRLSDLGVGTWTYRFEADQFGLRFETGEHEQVVEEQAVGGCGNGITVWSDPSRGKVGDEFLLWAKVEDQAGRPVPDRMVEFLPFNGGRVWDPQRAPDPDEPVNHYTTAYTRNEGDVPDRPDLVGTARVRFEATEPGLARIKVVVHDAGECWLEIPISSMALRYEWHLRERRHDDDRSSYEVRVWIHREDGEPLRNKRVEFSGYIRPRAGGARVPIQFKEDHDLTSYDGLAVAKFTTSTEGIAFVTARVPSFEDEDTTSFAVSVGRVPAPDVRRTLDVPEPHAVDWLQGRGSRLWGTRRNRKEGFWREDLSATTPDREETVHHSNEWYFLKTRRTGDGIRALSCDYQDLYLLDGETLDVVRHAEDILPEECTAVDWLSDTRILVGMEDCTDWSCLYECTDRLRDCRRVGPSRSGEQDVVDVEVQPGGSGRYLLLVQHPDADAGRHQPTDLYVMRADHTVEAAFQNLAGPEDRCYRVSWAPDGASFAVACEDEVFVFDYPGLGKKQIPADGSDGNLVLGRDAAGHPRMVLTNEDWRILVYDAREGYRLREGEEEGGPVLEDADALAWNDEFYVAAVAGVNGKVSLVNLSGDEKPPRIEFGSYSENVERDVTAVTIPVRIEDPSWVVRVHRSVNGGPEELVEVPARQERVDFETRMELGYGDNVLRVCAYDFYGNGSGEGENNPRACREARVRRRDDPPVVEDVRVEPGRVAPGEEVVIRATVSDVETGVDGDSVVAHVQWPDEEEVRSVGLHDDGVSPDEVSGDGVYAGTLTTEGLGERRFFVDVVARDTNGNVGEAENAARVEVADDPVILSMWHAPGDATSADPITFYARVTDGTGVVGVTLEYRHHTWSRERRVEMEEREPGLWAYVDENLWRGAVSYRVIARDGYGHESSDMDDFGVSCAESESVDEDGDGWLGCDECDDTSAERHPEAEELAGNGVDDDCDGMVDELERSVPMEPGWRLVGLVVDDEETAGGMCRLADWQGGGVTRILRWEHRWLSYDCAVGLGDFAFEPGSGYFVQVREGFEWPQEGDELPSPFLVPLEEGWTLMSLPSWAAGKKASEVCGDLEISGCLPLMVMHWTGHWRSYDCAVGLGDFALEEGEGFFVRVGDYCTARIRRGEE